MGNFSSYLSEVITVPVYVLEAYLLDDFTQSLSVEQLKTQKAEPCDNRINSCQ